jgi:hypothetical protein
MVVGRSAQGRPNRPAHLHLDPDPLLGYAVLRASLLQDGADLFEPGFIASAGIGLVRFYREGIGVTSVMLAAAAGTASPRLPFQRLSSGCGSPGR